VRFHGNINAQNNPIKNILFDHGITKKEFLKQEYDDIKQELIGRM